MPTEPAYSELTAAEREAEQRAAASAAASAATQAARAPRNAYNDNLNAIDQIAVSENILAGEIDAYHNNTNGFQTEVDMAARNRRLTLGMLFLGLLLVPADAFLALGGISRLVLEWVLGIFSADGSGPASIPTLVLIGAALMFALALWLQTLGVKAGTSTMKQQARLQVSTSALEIRRLRFKIRCKMAVRAAYLLAFGFLLWTVHEDARRRIAWMNETSAAMKQQSLLDQRAADMMLDAAAAQTPAVAVTDVAVSSAGTGVGAEGFVLTVLFALHALVLCAMPSFTPVNPRGAKPFNLRDAESRLVQSKVTKSRMVRSLWDQLNDMPEQERRSRVDAMPVRIARIVNDEFGRELIITDREPPLDAGAGVAIAPAPPPAPMPAAAVPAFAAAAGEALAAGSLAGVL